MRDRLPSAHAVPWFAPRLRGGFAPAALLAALLDVSGLRPPGPLGPARWLEIAAGLGLLAAAALRRRGEPAAWSTPLDGRIAALLAVLILVSLGSPPHNAAAGFRVVLAGLACFYALSALVSQDPPASEAAWRVFPTAATILGLHALWAATGGLAHLADLTRVADAAWGAPGGLACALAFATLLTLGRALERGALPTWRLSAVVGVIGTALHLAAAGAPFGIKALSRLEAPLTFSATMVAALVLHGLGRTGWTLRRDRRREAPRWWGAMAGVTLLGAWLLFGSGPPGEGLALLAVLAGALVAAAPGLPSALPTAPAAAPPAPAASLRRAA